MFMNTIVQLSIQDNTVHLKYSANQKYGTTQAIYGVWDASLSNYILVQYNMKCEHKAGDVFIQAGQDDQEHLNMIYKAMDERYEGKTNRIENQKRLDNIIEDVLLKDLLNKIMNVDPKKRWSCCQALGHPFFFIWINEYYYIFCYLNGKRMLLKLDWRNSFMEKLSLIGVCRFIR